MTFSNIQNVEISQGPVQRLFGIADLKVQTAGGGKTASSGEEHESLADNLHIGFFRGVDNADELRELLLGYLRRLRTAGLGDPGEPAAAAGEAEEPAEAKPAAAGGLREVLRETRALSGSIGGSGNSARA